MADEEAAVMALFGELDKQIQDQNYQRVVAQADTSTPSACAEADTMTILIHLHTLQSLRALGTTRTRSSAR